MLGDDNTEDSHYRHSCARHVGCRQDSSRSLHASALGTDATPTAITNLA